MQRRKSLEVIQQQQEEAAKDETKMDTSGGAELPLKSEQDAVASAVLSAALKAENLGKAASEDEPMIAPISATLPTIVEADEAANGG